MKPDRLIVVAELICLCAFGICRSIIAAFEAYAGSMAETRCALLLMRAKGCSPDGKDAYPRR